MPTATAKATALVTTDELTELAEWELKYAKRTREVAEAAKELEFRRIQLAEKVLGVKSKDELKVLTPEQVEKKLEKRLKAGDWKPERGAPEFDFVKTSSGQYPAWRQEFIAAMGESAAARIAAEAPLTHSYRVEVSLP